MPVGTTFKMAYDDGVAYSTGGQTLGGSVKDVEIDSKGIALTNPGPVVLYAKVFTDLLVNEPSISGQVTLPAGTAASWSIGSQTGKLTNGHFSIPTGVTVGAPKPPASGLSVRCRADGSVCRARVPIAGGASNQPLTVKLPGVGYRLASTTVSPPSSRGAYRLTRTRYGHGGRQWLAVLNAAQANGPGAHLTLTFARRGAA